MEELILKLGGWAYVIVPVLVGIFTSFATEAVNLTLEWFGKNFHPKWIVVVFSIIFSWVMTNILPSLHIGVWEYGLFFILNIIVAIPFYNRVGIWTVDLLFKNYKAAVKEKIKLKEQFKNEDHKNE